MRSTRQRTELQRQISNDYSLPISRCVQANVKAKDNREVGITKLNSELKTTVAKINPLRSGIDAIVAETEGVNA